MVSLMLFGLCFFVFFMVVGFFIFIGCVKGLFWRLGYFNLWVVNEWKEEEEFIVLFLCSCDMIVWYEFCLGKL